MSDSQNKETPSLSEETALRLVYEPLEDLSDSFRLLELLPTSQGQKISCVLRNYRITEVEEYEVEEYEWGDEDEPQEIVVNDMKFPVRRNLHSFLSLPSTDNGSKRLLFIDTICIDQANTTQCSGAAYGQDISPGAPRQRMAWTCST